MWGLLAYTIITSSVDSLNPIAIVQQFVLQGMVKKPSHIWYFILPTGITNLITGYLAYYGFVTFISGYFNALIEKHGQLLFLLELILGISFLIATCYIIQNAKIKELKKQIDNINNSTVGDDIEEMVSNKIKSVAPFALVTLGVGATIAELTTALPYFAFLAILFNYELSLLEVSVILFAYNFIYTSPLMILYFIYSKAQDKFDRLYNIIRTKMTKLKNIIAPAFVGIIGAVLVWHSLFSLLS